MTHKEINQILEQYFTALKAGDASNLPFTKDITFNGPMVGAIQGESEVSKLVIGVSKTLQKMELKVISHIIDDHEVCSRAELTLPSGKVVALLDYFRFENGKISYIQPYFDSRPMAEIWGHL